MAEPEDKLNLNTKLLDAKTQRKFVSKLAHQQLCRSLDFWKGVTAHFSLTRKNAHNLIRNLKWRTITSVSLRLNNLVQYSRERITSHTFADANTACRDSSDD